MRLLSADQLAEQLNVNRVTIWRWSRDRDFPAPIALSAGCVRWRAAEVEAWIADRADEGAARRRPRGRKAGAGRG